MQEGRVAEHLVNEANKYLGSEATDTVDGMFHLQNVYQGHPKVATNQTKTVFYVKPKNILVES